MSIPTRGWVAAVVAVGLLATRGGAQERSPIDFPFVPTATLTAGDLRRGPTSDVGFLLIENRGPVPVTVRVPSGVSFQSAGVQTVATFGSVTQSIPGTGLARSGHVRRATAQQGGPVPVLLAGTKTPERAAIELTLLCTEAHQPAPTPETTWALAPESPATREVRGHLARLETGVARCDARIAALAPSVVVRSTEGPVQIAYSGPPLDEAGGHWLRAADWSRGPDGATRGRLNRPVVVQFALWALTDQLTEDDLDRRFREPRFAAARPRAESVRWAVRRLLAESGFKPALFDPNSAETAYNRGVADTNANRLDAAETRFRRVLELRPDSAPARFNLALTLARRGRLDDARAVWDDLARRGPADADVAYNLGCLAYREKRWDTARSAFETALRTNPNHPLARIWLEKARSKAGPSRDADP